ncbi:hypothetical protein M427DRAFT_253419 [Gonapodya prolifera JEL478]|uniref:Uncharacterized protein n=1 Tax=Gonapodya prolifera (strain JEL478) TaxID=1344416 RepID=A0A139AL66_GONPJ|nr:hypothetical protein M427DRAFT_253419 [Gonapodya prolifera JEL478]|eukprot:KXS17537.1 hypothetical protein M427DRAFT_253419 [Gonapodya prolifera JEL478]
MDIRRFFGPSGATGKGKKNEGRVNDEDDVKVLPEKSTQSPAKSDQRFKRDAEHDDALEPKSSKRKPPRRNNVK